MKIIIIDKSQNIEITCFDNLENIHDNLKKFTLIKDYLEVKFFAIDEKVLSSYTPTTIKSESELSQLLFEIFTLVRCAIEFLNIF